MIRTDGHYLLLFAVLLHFMLPCLSTAQVSWGEYPFPIDEEYREKLKFGYLSVPESRRDSTSKTLKIGFCVLKSTAEIPLKDAIIYLPGGPGQGYTSNAPYFLGGSSINRLLETRDIVLFDPRGCGTSSPQLCGTLEDPEVFNANLSGISNQEYLYLLAKAMRKCRDSIQSQGMQTTAYGSVDIAADIEDLRQALGYESWNIRGHSYGTRYAQSVLRQYSDKVRSAVLSSIVPATLAYEDRDFYGLIHALRLVLETCEADEACHKKYPELENDLLKMMRRLESNPIVLPEGTLPTLPGTAVVITPRVALDGIFLALYIREGVEMLPLLIHTAASGKVWIAEALTIALDINFGIDNDMYHFIRCNDNPGTRFAADPMIEDPLVAALYAYWRGDLEMTEEKLCENLSIPMDSLEQNPVRSDIPMLLYTGEFDPVTPSYYTDSLAKYATRATPFVVRGRGHDAPVPLADLMADFFISPNTPPDLAILDSLQPPHFLTEVRLNKGISAISVRIARGDHSGLAIAGGGILFLILIAFLYYPVRLLFAYGRHKTIPRYLLYYLPFWMVSVIALLFTGLLGLAFRDALNTHIYYLVFGLPRDWAFVLHGPWVMLIAWLACLLFLRKFWKGGALVSDRVFALVSCASVMLLVIFLWAWDVV